MVTSVQRLAVEVTLPAAGTFTLCDSTLQYCTVLFVVYCHRESTAPWVRSCIVEHWILRRRSEVTHILFILWRCLFLPSHRETPQVNQDKKTLFGDEAIYIDRQPAKHPIAPSETHVIYSVWKYVVHTTCRFKAWPPPLAIQRAALHSYTYKALLLFLIIPYHSLGCSAGASLLGPCSFLTVSPFTSMNHPRNHHATVTASQEGRATGEGNREEDREATPKAAPVWGVRRVE